jgi:hypothetical protein
MDYPQCIASPVPLIGVKERERQTDEDGEGEERGKGAKSSSFYCRRRLLDGKRWEIVGSVAFAKHWERLICEAGGVIVQRLFTESER